MSVSFEIKGAVKLVGETAEYGASGFRKREFVVTVEDGKYPQDVKLEMVQDAVSKLDLVNVGDEVEVSFNIRGNEHNGKYYVNLQAWKLDVLSQGAGADLPPLEDVPDDFDDDSGVPF